MIKKLNIDNYQRIREKDIKYDMILDTQVTGGIILHSFTASQLHSFTASQLHSFTA